MGKGVRNAWLAAARGLQRRGWSACADHDNFWCLEIQAVMVRAGGPPTTGQRGSAATLVANRVLRLGLCYGRDDGCVAEGLLLRLQQALPAAATSSLREEETLSLPLTK